MKRLLESRDAARLRERSGDLEARPVAVVIPLAGPAARFSHEIRWLASSLLLSLIPLHAAENRTRFLDLCLMVPQSFTERVVR